MGNAFRSLQRELEPLGSRIAPAEHGLCAWHAIEGVVDLDTREMLRVVRQHLRSRQLVRIEATAPLRIVVSRGADPDLHVTGDPRPLSAADTAPGGGSHAASCR